MSKIFEIVRNYPRYNHIASNDLARKIFEGVDGGDWLLNQTIRQGKNINTYAIRISEALNASNLKIKASGAGTATGKSWKTLEKGTYILTVTKMKSYLQSKYSMPFHVNKIVHKERYSEFLKSLPNKSGIMVLLNRTGRGDFNGHVDIWHLGRFIGRDYLEEHWVGDIYFWEGYKIK